VVSVTGLGSKGRGLVGSNPGVARSDKCKKLQFIHKLTASDTSKTAKKSQKDDITHQQIAYMSMCC